MIEKLWRVAKLVLPEAFGVILIVGSIYIIRLVFEYLLGKDATFFDTLPIRYVTDAGEFIVLLKFIWRCFRGKFED